MDPNNPPRPPVALANTNEQTLHQQDDPVDRSLQHTPPPTFAVNGPRPPPPESMFSPKPVPPPKQQNYPSIKSSSGSGSFNQDQDSRINTNTLTSASVLRPTAITSPIGMHPTQMLPTNTQNPPTFTHGLTQLSTTSSNSNSTSGFARRPLPFAGKQKDQQVTGAATDSSTFNERESSASTTLPSNVDQSQQPEKITLERIPHGSNSDPGLTTDAEQNQLDRQQLHTSQHTGIKSVYNSMGSTATGIKTSITFAGGIRPHFPPQQSHLKESAKQPPQQTYPSKEEISNLDHPVHHQQYPPHPPGFQAPPEAAQSFDSGLPIGIGTIQQPQGTTIAGPLGGMRELRVEDALLYLDDVKREFKDRPAIYNEFLAIMKNFKTQEVDTPGVIARVSNLFRGYNNLILGFNTFLPEGFKISLADLERAEAIRQAEEAAAASAAAAAAVAAVARKKTNKGAKRGPKPKLPPQVLTSGPEVSFGMPKHSQPPSPHPQPAQSWISSGQGMPPPGNSPPAQKLPPPPPPRGPFEQQLQQAQQQQQQQQPPPHQAVEFDHAISYVTTIKKRFASDPNTYHSFLEILHTYQKEQRGIKEVLEQVAHLFQDHPDLLKEFTFFLPDAVQEQAKERLHRAAAESESRIAAQRQQQIDDFQQRSVGTVAADIDTQQHKFLDMTHSQQMAAAATAATTVQKRDGIIPLMQTPESYVYNSAVERQFFDATREALSSYARDGGQAWAEFIKCLDMYAQEILSKSEMLNFVQPLLGKRNNHLFEEFKRILNAAGSLVSTTPQMMEDSWYSVPLAEIDFSRCRRCSPSYRALPRDYPMHPCSGRSETEANVLNDIWVSLPVGSEESYVFRHMKRNTYEETLFRVEDERFEIDMVIDSNAATLQRLLPIAQEIALLSQEDVIPSDLGIKPSVEGTGLGGRRFQYTFNKKILGVIHRNAIARIYGESGQDMLDLLVKNPSVAIPLVVSRLRQKNTEWQSVRNRLNKQWSELAEHNYYKSLDHRSLTWRTVDKRALSTRTLIAEIKDHAANHGREGAEAFRQKLDKAKEEHGSFYEVTVGSKLSTAVDLTFLPKPDRRLFSPHLSLIYMNVSWAQRDAYRILAFALERGPISPADKERCHRLWVEFLGPWFGLSLNWMQEPAVTYQESSVGVAKRGRVAPTTIVSEDDEDSMDDEPELVSHMVTEQARDEIKDKDFTDHHPLPSGVNVLTLYGEGKVIEFRHSDHIYAVQLNFGAIGYLRPSTVLCSMLPVEKSAYTRQLRAEDRSKLARRNDQLAFGTQSLYLFFRLHQILVDRLNTAKRLAYAVGDDQSLQSMVEQMPKVNPKAVGRRRYEAYLSLVYALLDGGVGGVSEGGKYEDRVRSLLGHGGYELATMDKLIAHIWKDIQTMANDETMWSLVQLYRRHSLAGGFQPEAFRQEAAYLSDGEPMYAFQHCPLSFKDRSVLHIEYVGVMDDVEDDDMDEEVDIPLVEAHANKRQKR